MARSSKERDGEETEQPSPLPEIPKGGRHIVRTIGEVCQFLKVTAPTFQKYLQQGCPGESGGKGKQNGTFHLDEIVAWMRENIWRPKPTDSLDELDRQKLTAEVRIINLKADNLAGTLVERMAVAAELKTILNIVRGRLDQLPQELSNVLPTKMRTEFKRDAKNKVDLIKRELAEIGQQGGL